MVIEAHLKPCYPHVAMCTRKYTRTLARWGEVGCRGERDRKRKKEIEGEREGENHTEVVDRYLLLCSFGYLCAEGTSRSASFAVLRLVFVYDFVEILVVKMQFPFKHQERRLTLRHVLLN